MKKILYLATILAIVQVTAVSCDDEETYADQKERENKQINQFLKDNKKDYQNNREDSAEEKPLLQIVSGFLRNHSDNARAD